MRTEIIRTKIAEIQDDRLSYEFLSERLVDFEEFIGKMVDLMKRI